MELQGSKPRVRPFPQWLNPNLYAEKAGRLPAGTRRDPQRRENSSGRNRPGVWLYKGADEQLLRRSIGPVGSIPSTIRTQC